MHMKTMSQNKNKIFKMKYEAQVHFLTGQIK